MGDHVGEVMTINGRNYTITNILSEKHKPEFHELWAVYEATIAETRQRFALKARYQLRAPVTSERDLVAENKMAMDNFNDEHRALRECQESGSTPRFFGHAEFTDGSNPFYRRGYVRVIAMSLARGTSVVEIPTLRDQDHVRAAIREKLTETLEYVRLRGWTFYQPETEQIFYDSSTRSICLVGFSRAGKETLDPSREPPITQTSIDVVAFGLGWRRE
ncbi:hypothetical protein BO78DRAFT_419991 [Aspergillus sclerotiicarbonarius CBS 121057]|uniref:Uncharacterized protein n=1 Tax=Aspergillus sclerotiicarbonarius (strain CBS 121057 / IBT 28362) TaxID=1448318 RepID=A0A319FER9_ASPSB|nr:hypothetical protein BO78DRAFT_419991 [Aspergillus sclerotiicarbonarius CBS 121057]